ncbi:exodeoxyribonuclease III [Candidatus Venteria ishoeyi]|uniref:Exodeoxyribonuclease III n=1 Tax=Candidatus Venteria ishoeyi TaxID=1899563 RepID=A0A1H6FF63_9GAMM|nr:exodeoxyribonuclease III [Candidatus Venteria ishoeyi]MDM8545110.1 exodeoxyribonuclease III [Candidatus Venteria ishoeyi]SEH08657.1 Exodeoxyribonuclease III [Candidatus Venteria ishoeyi]
MNIISFNTNSIRIRLHQLAELINKYQPDVIGIQETKVQDADFPVEAIAELGYQSAFHGQKTHYGVALLSKQPLADVQKGFPGDADNAQRRFIGGTLSQADGSKLHVLNGYFPQGENREHPEKFANKRQYYADLLAYLQAQFNPESDQLILMGDMNVAPLDLDVGIGEANAKRWLKTGACSFLPEEREWLDTLMNWGLVDSFRSCHPHAEDALSWFDYRSKGFNKDPRRGLRIDLILASKALADQCVDAGIDYDIRAMDKPSDHCPIWASFRS